MDIPSIFYGLEVVEGDPSVPMVDKGIVRCVVVLILAECVFIDDPVITGSIEQRGRDPRLQGNRMLAVLLAQQVRSAYLQHEPSTNFSKSKKGKWEGWCQSRFDCYSLLSEAQYIP